MKWRFVMCMLASVSVLAGFGSLASADYLGTLSSMSGLVSNWHLDETTGTTAADAVTNDTLDGNNPGTYSGTGYTLGVAGPGPSDGFLGFSSFNKAVTFAADTGTRLQMATYAPYGGLTDATLVMWVKYPEIPSSSSYRRFAGGLVRNASSNRYMFAVGLYEPTADPKDDGGLQAFVRRSDATGGNNLPKYNPGIGTWHMVVNVFREGKYADIYIDGEFKQTYFSSDTSVGLAAPGWLVFGVDPYSTPSRPWKGELDEIAIFNRGLSADDVAALWNAATVPEPSALALVIGGLLGLLCYAWRKRR